MLDFAPNEMISSYNILDICKVSSHLFCIFISLTVGSFNVMAQNYWKYFAISNINFYGNLTTRTYSKLHKLPKKYELIISGLICVTKEIAFLVPSCQNARKRNEHCETDLLHQLEERALLLIETEIGRGDDEK
ncbi:hypothetical protein EGR_10984 [Echinococcus granulosus]|uniref:Uncharacterized protein n=1 Tax=Echinococcus granulosus TaxID=6210 RepID=W6UKY5_ECHGR|nr:hypothetical protein EGR_10984 [Echinococcus granulosus]EUB54159.1 hypothetical protein EGR_10984 [Echinococcus granulosus]